MRERERERERERVNIVKEKMGFIWHRGEGRNFFLGWANCEKKYLIRLIG